MFGNQILFERQPESMMTYANFDSLRPGFNMDPSSSLTTCGDLWVSTPFRGSFLFTLCERVVSQNASNPSDQIMKFWWLSTTNKLCFKFQVKSSQFYVGFSVIAMYGYPVLLVLKRCWTSWTKVPTGRFWVIITSAQQKQAQNANCIGRILFRTIQNTLRQNVEKLTCLYKNE